METSEQAVRPEGPRTETLNPPLEAPDVLLMPAATARLFGITTRTLINWVRRGKLPAQRTVGGQRRYRESDVRALLYELKAAA